MINIRAISTLGIGFGAKQIAAIGLLPSPTITIEECGTLCCSIITGHFNFGCTPITAKFDLNYGCKPSEVPIFPPVGLGGGGSRVSSSFLVPFHTKAIQCNRTVMVTVKFTQDKVWRKIYAVDICNDSKLITVEDINNTTNKPIISVEHITQSKHSSVKVSFKKR